MTDDLGSWVIIAFATLGAATAVVAFLRTPRELRYRSILRKSLAEQLKDFPESAHAVIIKGNRTRAFVKSAPYIVIGVVLAGFSLWIKNTSHLECVKLLGFNAAYLSWVFVCYGVPISYFVVLFLFLRMGINTIKTGYFPPLDAVVFNDTIAKKGTVSLLRGVILVALPVFTLYTVYLGNNVYTAVAAGKNMQEILEKLEAECQ